MPSYQYRKSHCGDKTILWPSYLHNGISYTGKMTYLYWMRALFIIISIVHRPTTGFIEVWRCSSRLYSLSRRMSYRKNLWSLIQWKLPKDTRSGLDKWGCFKPFNQWQHSFLIWKLCCHWLKGLQQHHEALVTTHPSFRFTLRNNGTYYILHHPYYDCSDIYRDLQI